MKQRKALVMEASSGIGHEVARLLIDKMEGMDLYEAQSTPSHYILSLVLAGHDPIFLLEALIEISGRCEAHLPGYLRDIVPSLNKQVCGFLQSPVGDVFIGRHAEEVPHFAIESCTPDVHLLCQHVHTERGVIDMFADHRLHLLAKEKVGTILKDLSL